jgi:hypothetical protein
MKTTDLSGQSGLAGIDRADDKEQITIPAPRRKASAAVNLSGTIVVDQQAQFVG